MDPSALAPLADKRIVVMPDVYVDVLVPLPAWRDSSRELDAIAARGGGNLPVGPMHTKLGGNAANLAVALARLGARVELVAETDELGLRLLRSAAQGTRLSLDRVRLVPQGAGTVALECSDANVMMSHAGPVAHFGPERLTEDDHEALARADAVAVVNWAQNQRGTELMDAVAEALGGTDTFLFIDTADPRHRGDDLEALLAARCWSRVDAWGLNDNELAAASGPAARDPLEAAHRLAARLGVRLDLHTREWAASVTPERTVQVAAHQAPGRRRTGAGDAWNAGDLVGHVLGWGDEARLRFAHDVATAYVTGTTGLPPAPHELGPVSGPGR